MVAILALAWIIGPAAPPVAAFPSYDAGYHTYEELTDRIHAIERAYPNLVKISSIGRSHQGRELWMAKVSDNPGVTNRSPKCCSTGAITVAST